MRKLVVFLLSLVVLTWASVAFAATPKTVKIDAAAKKQPAVTFTHEKHTQGRVAKCETCHHTNKGMKTDAGVKVAKCSTCHLDPKVAKAGNMRDASMTTNPMHKLCISCHKTGKKGPVVCNKCHVKA